MDSHIDLLKIFLPELLITHFEIPKYEIKKNILHIYFEEKKLFQKNFH